jgi:hypothetical protein
LEDLLRAEAGYAEVLETLSYVLNENILIRRVLTDAQSRAPGRANRLPPRTDRVERMNLKEATVRRYHYHSHQLRQHIQTFLDAHNFAKRLETSNGLTSSSPSVKRG